MRQVFLRLIAELRGQHNHLVDFTGDDDLIYLASKLEDALVPLPAAPCGLLKLDGMPGWNESKRCAHLSSAKWNVEPIDVSSSDDIDKAQAVRATFRWVTDSLTPTKWAEPHVRLIYFKYVRLAFPGVVDALKMKPDVLVAGAIGAHVPCWSDGHPGTKCSIEQFKAYEQFWSGVYSALNRPQRAGDESLPVPESTPLPFVWLTMPWGHSGARHQSQHYGTYNQLNEDWIRRLWRNSSSGAPHILRFNEIIAKSSGRASVLMGGRSDSVEGFDRLHFMCLAAGPRGATRYERFPYLHVARLRTVKVLADAAERGSKVERNVSDGCADHVNRRVVGELFQYLLASQQNSIRPGCDLAVT